MQVPLSYFSYHTTLWIHPLSYMCPYPYNNRELSIPNSFFE